MKGFIDFIKSRKDWFVSKEEIELDRAKKAFETLKIGGNNKSIDIFLKRYLLLCQKIGREVSGGECLIDYQRFLASQGKILTLEECASRISKNSDRKVKIFKKEDLLLEFKNLYTENYSIVGKNLLSRDQLTVLVDNQVENFIANLKLAYEFNLKEFDEVNKLQDNLDNFFKNARDVLSKASKKALNNKGVDLSKKFEIQEESNILKQIEDLYTEHLEGYEEYLVSETISTELLKFYSYVKHRTLEENQTNEERLAKGYMAQFLGRIKKFFVDLFGLADEQQSKDASSLGYEKLQNQPSPSTSEGIFQEEELDNGHKHTEALDKRDKKTDNSRSL